MRTRAAAAVIGLLAVAVLPPAAADRRPAPVDEHLAGQLATLAHDAPIRVLLHAGDSAAAEQAARDAGLRVGGRLSRIGVAIAGGTASAVAKVRRDPRVRFVEGDRPIEWHLDSSHEATRGTEARSGSRGTPGADGSGVSIAVVDTGIDGTHPFFLDAEGESKVVRNVRTVCPIFSVLVYHPACFVDEPVRNDTDIHGAGGHGTHVAGIAAGYDVTTTAPQKMPLRGAAPGARLVGISVSAGPSMASGTTGLNWVLDNHKNPCAAPRVCPPIKVVNNSWGPAGGSEFCEQCAAVKLQRELVAAGVVVVWSAGNSGGDGSGKDFAGQPQTTGGNGKDPTPGVLSVANYDDGGSGERDRDLARSSSRGVLGDPRSYPDLAAPGTLILSSCRPWLPLCDPLFGADGPGPEDKLTFAEMTGTSMAAPHIAGIVAQLFDANPSATPAQIEWALVTTAYKFGGGYEAAPRWRTTTSFDKGHGLVDAAAAVRAIVSRDLPSDAALGASREDEDEGEAENARR